LIVTLSLEFALEIIVYIELLEDITNMLLQNNYYELELALVPISERFKMLKENWILFIK